MAYRFHSGFIRRLVAAKKPLFRPLPLQRRLRPVNHRTTAAKAIHQERTKRSGFWYAAWRVKEHNRLFRDIKPGDAGRRVVQRSSMGH